MSKLNYSAYCRLMRFHKPIGIWLLWLPTAWALWIANHGHPALSLIIKFFLGTVVMRAAGCVVNDMIDRHIDKHVARTHDRPLTSGEVTLSESLYLLLSLFFVAFIIVIQLPLECFYYSFFALVLTIFYPFCKRFFQAPQLILGIAFSMAIPMVYVASQKPFDEVMWILIMMNIAWIVAYDTMYAMADRDDDLKIGVMSTAVLFGDYDRVVVLMLQVFYHSLWLYIAWILSFPVIFYVGWFAAIRVLINQQRLITERSAVDCFHAFEISRWYGAILWLAILTY